MTRLLVTWLTVDGRKELNVSVVFQFRATMEGKLPQFNTRVKLPMTSDRLAVYDGKLGMNCKLILHVVRKMFQNERVQKYLHVKL